MQDEGSLAATATFAHASRMRLRVVFPIVLLFVSLLAGCATRPVPPAMSRVVVEPDERPGFWRATYELTEKASEIRFERTPIRTGVFEVLTPGYAIVREGETEVLRTAGAPTDRIVVRFPELTRELEKEYDFFQKFTDGSVAIYTGHLAAVPQSGPAVRRFHFVPPAGHHVVAGGTVVNGPADWIDRDGDGAYIYIGTIQPIETDELISIVDPGLPSWLWEETRKALPRVFNTYARRLGVSPSERPLVLFNYTDGGGSGYSSGGGVLPGQIQLRADGAAWKERSDEAFLRLFRFLAHEAAHLWNGRIIRYSGSDDAWMHEGSADALTDRMLLELGLVDDAGYRALQADALNECRRQLGSFPLRDASKRKAFQLYYSCGNSLALFTENAVANHDLFDFWKTLIARMRASGRTEFDTADYFAAMSAAGATSANVERLRAFTGQSATADALADMLRTSGVRLAEAAPSEAFGQSVARDALFRILGEQCTGPYGFTVVESGFSVTDSDTCGALSGGGIVTAIDGHDVLRDGSGAGKALHERCGSGVPLQIDVAADGVTKRVAVDCRKPFAAPPAFLKIEAPLAAPR